MNSVVPSTQGGISEGGNLFDFSFRTSVPPKRYVPPMKAEPTPLASKEKINSESSSDPEFDEVEEEDLSSKQKDEEEEEYTIFSKAIATAAKMKKARGPAMVARPGGKSVSNSQNKKKKVCEFCGASDTPMWRRGPQGKGTLCNACGVKWSLKFRKKNGNKRELDPADKNKSTRKSSRKDKPIGRTKRSPYDDEEMDSSNEQSEMYCKSCGITWPSHYFRGANITQCNNCSRKQMIMIRSDSPPEKLEQEEDYLPRQAKRRRAMDDDLSSEVSKPPESDETNDSFSDMETDLRGNKLFTSLLNVVENKLVEYHELETICKDIMEWKETLLQRDEVRNRLMKTQLQEMQSQLNTELKDLRQKADNPPRENLSPCQTQFVNRLETNVNSLLASGESLLVKLEQQQTESPLSGDTKEFCSKLRHFLFDTNKEKAILHNCTEEEASKRKQTLINALDSTERKWSTTVEATKTHTQRETEAIKQQIERMAAIFRSTS